MQLQGHYSMFNEWLIEKITCVFKYIGVFPRYFREFSSGKTKFCQWNSGRLKECATACNPKSKKLLLKLQDCWALLKHGNTLLYVTWAKAEPQQHSIYTIYILYQYCWQKKPCGPQWIMLVNNHQKSSRYIKYRSLRQENPIFTITRTKLSHLLLSDPTFSIRIFTPHVSLTNQ